MKMNAEKEAAEILNPQNVTHYHSAHYKRVISELVRLIANERREHAQELREFGASNQADRIATSGY